MQCSGRVVGVKGEIAQVLIESTACEGCGACGLSTLRDRKSMEVNALNEFGAGEGDIVNLEVSGKKVVWASAVLFMVPFLFLLAGIMLGQFVIGPLLGVSEALCSVVTGFVLLGASYYLVYRLGSRSEFEFVIKSVEGR